MKPLYSFASALALMTLSTACGSSGEPQTRPAAVEPAATEVEKTEEPAGAEAPAGEGEEAPAEAGEAEDLAPDFTLTDLSGNEVTLSSYRGKKVILEWFNPGCPFVVYAHAKGPLKTMAREKMDEGMVWLAINSGAPGKQGHGAQKNKKAKKKWAMASPILVDESGEVGKAYGAKATPHMYLIDEEGKLVYRGAIDNAPQGKVPDEGHVNYVEKALADLAAGRPVETPETQAYGCSVKYAE